MLTDTIRAYLRAAREAGYRSVYVVAELCHVFGLTGEQAGEIILQDLMETTWKR